MAPIIAVLLPGQRVPQLILLILGGVLIGSEVLGLEVSPEVELISDVGLGMVFLLAGFEIDPTMLFDRPGRLALVAWVTALVDGWVAVVGGLSAIGYVEAFTAVALALTTTALGTGLRIFREKGMLLAATWGSTSSPLEPSEKALPDHRHRRLPQRQQQVLGPDLLGSDRADRPGAGRVPSSLRPRRSAGRHRRTGGRRHQPDAMLRLTILLLLGSLVLAGEFGLDVVLGKRSLAVRSSDGGHRATYMPSRRSWMRSVTGSSSRSSSSPQAWASTSSRSPSPPTGSSSSSSCSWRCADYRSSVVYRRALPPPPARPAHAARSATTLPLLVALTPDRPVDRDDAARERGGAGRRRRPFRPFCFPLVATALHRPGTGAGDQP